jgi:hypothetical protein
MYFCSGKPMHFSSGVDTVYNGDIGFVGAIDLGKLVA